ncbi:MFS transporter [Actinoallomurus sp. CA-142502]|uniref:MFS transporter n=1 Tax=Actinoallomurus sp. CA-142502 TaxID=3239885 RepID=UPI003D8A1202
MPPCSPPLGRMADRATPPERRGRAVRVWSAIGALAGAFGSVVGGLLVDASWRWVFLVNLPVGVAAMAGAVRWVPDSRDETAGRTPDVFGAVNLAVAIGAVALGLVKGPDWGGRATGITAAFVCAVLAGVVFTVRTWRHPSPVVEPALVRPRIFVWANVTTLLFSVAFGAAVLSMIMWSQDVWHYSALRTGLCVVPGPLLLPVLAAVGQRVAHRVPAALVAGAGCVVFGAGTVVIVLSLGTEPNYATELLPGWLITGAGVGLALPAILSASTSDLPPGRTATGSAVVTMSRQIGTVLGVSVLVAVLGTPVGADQALTGFTHVRWVIAGVTVLAALTAAGMTVRTTPAAWIPPSPGTERIGEPTSPAA